MDIDWELGECGVVVGQEFIMQSQKMGCLTQHISFISEAMLTYRILPMCGVADFTYSVWYDVAEKLKFFEKTKSTQGATSQKKNLYREQHTIF